MVHNVHTSHAPLNMIVNVILGELSPHRYYYSHDNGKTTIDCQASAISNATLTNFVEDKFLDEIAHDYFLDHLIIVPGTKRKIKEKSYPKICEILMESTTTT